MRVKVHVHTCKKKPYSILHQLSNPSPDSLTDPCTGRRSNTDFIHTIPGLKLTAAHVYVIKTPVTRTPPSLVISEVASSTQIHEN